MIIDLITNAHLYADLGLKIKRAFNYIQQTDLLALDVGRYEMEGASMYVVVQEYVTKPKDQGRWETHRRYIDLQYIIRGTERIGYAHLSRLAPGVYDADKDFLAFSGEGDFLTLTEGCFMLLLPEDAHMPGIAVDAPGIVKKAVVKIGLA
jgi:YhcH/YjgK/YiaL family protein